ncbi:MAG: hypothetical protein ACLRZ9_12555 [Eubacterium sp.]
MKLKIFIIEDKSQDAKKLKNNLEIIFQKYKESELFNTISEGIEVGWIEGEGEEEQTQYGYFKYYDCKKLIEQLKIILLNNSGCNDIKIGICLDIKLTREDAERNITDQELKTAKKVYNFLQGEKVNVCPITGIANFDENSINILGEEVNDGFFDKNIIINACIDSDIVKMIYFLANGYMPEQEKIDNMFNYD